jgi:WD40 repeat protein
MKILTGDETGLIKFVDTIKKKSVSYGTQSREFGILKFCWIIVDQVFGLLRKNGIVEIWNVKKGNIVKDRSFDLNLVDCIGITPMNDHTLLCYSTNGTVTILNLRETESDEPAQQTVRGPVAALEACSNLNRYACGGPGNDLQLWDSQEGKVLWSAKNVPNDSVRLAVPIYISSISFLRNGSDIDGNMIVTGTAHHHVRLYDIRTKRQPVQSWEPMEFKVTNVRGFLSTASAPSLRASSASSYCSLVSDCSGVVHSIDLLTGKLRASYTPAGGSVKDISMTSCGEYFTTVSYDRFVRVYEVNRKSERFQMHLKNRLTCCLAISEDEGGGSSSDKGKKRTGDGDDEGEDVLENYVDSDEENEEEDSEEGEDEEEASDVEGLEGEDAGEEDEEEGSEEEESDEQEEDDEEEEEEEEIVPKVEAKRDQKRRIQPAPVVPSKSSISKKPKHR